MGEELENKIKENAAGPKRASGDAGSVDQHSLKDQIDADRYLALKELADDPSKALKRVKIVPPGTA
ncbi:MAG: hypothetical protein ACP5HU_12935 [Phycisphaerae bacterium]